ncbi:hypothetical protein N9J61_02935 [Pelagibacterales bacterium]|jgi:hypothetical protein|nr:hypothetical protein [Pelagibacterales bacterium]|tara:strand:+ start:414 stop:551 length:138 start_codon:yes stop_codon:yes gene_type:complete
MLQIIILIASMFVGYGIFDSVLISFAIPIVILFIFFGYKAIFDKD